LPSVLRGPQPTLYCVLWCAAVWCESGAISLFAWPCTALSCTPATPAVSLCYWVVPHCTPAPSRSHSPPTTTVTHTATAFTLPQGIDGLFVCFGIARDNGLTGYQVRHCTLLYSTLLSCGMLRGITVSYRPSPTPPYGMPVDLLICDRFWFIWQDWIWFTSTISCITRTH
jgi:hypothetical protein